jgi:hypoxanthine phosphoribosyltransferase
MHTPLQVITGVFLGYGYATLYNKFNLSKYSFLLVFLAGFLISIYILSVIHKKVLEPVPKWVSKEMIPSIKKKQDTPLQFKLIYLYWNYLPQETIYISWKQLEQYLDILIEKIKSTNKQYDGIVGLKTGGAIISDYISNKLNIKNYKLKISKSSNGCNKTYQDSLKDIVNSSSEFIICEDITDNLEGKNLILIDELVASGNTINYAYKYLKNNKKANFIYTTTISLIKNFYKKKDINIEYVLDESIVVWPWGYDN